jgi:hypothetical protein
VRASHGREEMAVVSRNPQRAGGLPSRLSRLFLRRNELRRPSERIEAAVVAGLLTAFIAAIIVGAFFADHVYHSERAAAAGLRSTVAVISPSSEPAKIPLLNQPAGVRATWRLSDGRQHSGLLTSSVVPGIYRQPTGASVRIWLSRSGVPEPAPPGLDGMIVGAAMSGLAVVVAAAAVLACCYLLCLRALQRHRLANWSSAWAVTGPQWTHRQ